MAHNLKLWEPVQPGKLKALVFQYGKVASSALVTGFKLELRIAAAHAHQGEEARQWLRGQPTAFGAAVELRKFSHKFPWQLALTLNPKCSKPGTAQATLQGYSSRATRLCLVERVVSDARPPGETLNRVLISNELTLRGCAHVRAAQAEALGSK